MTNNNSLLVNEQVFEKQQDLENEIKRLTKVAKTNNVMFGSGTKMLTEDGKVIAFYIGGKKEESKLFGGVEQPYSPEAVLNIANHFRHQGATKYDEQLNDNVVPINYKGEIFKVTSDKRIKPSSNGASNVIADELRTLTLDTDNMERNIRLSYLTFGEDETLKALNKINDENYLISQETMVNKTKIEIPERERSVIEDAIDKMECGEFYQKKIVPEFEQIEKQNQKRSTRPKM